MNSEDGYRLKDEWRRAVKAARELDVQTTFVLVTCVVFVFLQYMIGDRAVFLATVGEAVPDEWQELGSWVWWFGMQGVLGFLIPVLCLWGLFGRSAREMGLGWGDWKLASMLALAYIPLAAIGTWVLSDGAAFQAEYPHYGEAAYSWRIFLIYQAFFLLYWIGWEYLWRGYVLFGTAHTFGRYAIIVQMVPFAVLHFEKPPAEAFLSIVGALVLGAIVWRCRAFWVAVPIHASQMMLLDLWSTLRIRTGVEGISPAALLEMLRQLGG